MLLHKSVFELTMEKSGLAGYVISVQLMQIEVDMLLKENNPPFWGGGLYTICSANALAIASLPQLT
jgi:hypothetical protein